MRRIEGIRRFFRLPPSEHTVERDVDEELAFHLESRVEELIKRGSSPQDARQQALREFGDPAGARDELAAIDRAGVRRARRSLFIDALRQDVQQSARTMRREPGFALAVIVTLGLGIGLNAAMFGITDRLLFRAPAHVRAPDQVKNIYFTQTFARLGLVSQRNTSFIDYSELRRNVSAFGSAGAYFNVEASLGRGRDARRIQQAITSASFFPTLGVQPQLGRFYTEEEDTPGKGATVVVLSDGFWRRHYAGKTSALGQKLPLGDLVFTVIGVAPRGFNGVELEPVDVFVPIAAVAPRSYGEDWNTARNTRWLQVVARLRPEATIALVEEQATAVMKRNLPSDWGDDASARVTAESIILARTPAGGSTTITDTSRIALWLSGVSLLVLVIACANVINLLLARAARRQREVGVRIALGVGRARLVGHFLIETLLLALVGGALGLLLAGWGGALARNLLLPDIDWGSAAVAVDRRMLVYATALILCCGLIAGLVPALLSLRTNLMTVLKSGAREGIHRSRTRMALVVVQATVTVVLLVGAGLFVRSLHNVRQLNKGFDPDNVLAMYWDFGVLDLAPDRWDALYHEAAARAKQLPLVENAAVAITVPFWSSISTALRVEGWDSLPRTSDGGPYYNGVTADYFTTVGTRILRGRGFTRADRAGAPLVAVVSVTMARMFWPGADPLGKCLYLIGQDPKAPCSQVVGVAEDALRQSLRAEVMQFYVPLDQLRKTAFRTLFVRTRGDRQAAKTQVRQAVQSLNPGLPFADLRYLDELMAPKTRPWRLAAALFSAFGLLALLLAALGLYSVIAYNVAQRAQEMSVRVALGARRRHVLSVVAGDVGRVLIAGILLGVAGAWIGAQQAASLLFDVSPKDPTVFLAVVGVLLLAGTVAALVPAARALAIQPIRALRND
jgi:putative ABC transport system permease protein